MDPVLAFITLKTVFINSIPTYGRGVPSLKKILDIRTSNYENILVLKHFY